MGQDSKHDPPSEGAILAGNVIEGILKTKKLFKIYPANNPIYINASKAAFGKFNSFFLHEKELSIQLSQHQIFYTGEEIYHNPEKDDNLALFLFKDGIREITFLKGMPQEELDKFLRLLAIDFEKDAPDDDIVTVLWEKDFEHIKYIADDILLTDDEMSDEKKAYEKARENACSDDSINKAYQGSLSAKIEEEYIPTPLNETDLQHISEDIASLKKPREYKLTTILFELLYHRRAFQNPAAASSAA